MKKLKKILSLLTLIVVVGSEVLTSFSYALNDIVENSDVIEAERIDEDEEEEENIEESDSSVDEVIEDETPYNEMDEDSSNEEVGQEIQGNEDSEGSVIKSEKEENDESGDEENFQYENMKQEKEDSEENMGENVIDETQNNEILTVIQNGDENIGNVDENVLDGQEKDEENMENMADIDEKKEEKSQGESTVLIPEGQEGGGITDKISEDFEKIIENFGYFFKKEGDSRYIKYGKDKNNIGTITLKDPKTSFSITIMDKNLGANVVGIGNGSYGYYFQWGNNHGVESVNSTNKTAQKAVYNDNYYSHGYDGNGVFIVGSSDYWENGEHYNSLWGNESKESSRYGACPVGYHIPTIKEWNQLLDIWGKIHTQDTSTSETVLRYSADYATRNIHTFKGAVTQCVQGDKECVDEDKLSIIIEILSLELKLPLAGSYDENGNFHDGLGVYWTSIAKDGNKAGVFDMNTYIGDGTDGALMYKSQGHNIRCFQNLEPYEAPVNPEIQNDESSNNDTSIDSSDDELTSKLQIGSGVDSQQNGVNFDESQNDEENTQDSYPESGIPSDIEPDLIIQDTTGDIENYEIDAKEYTITWKNEDGSIRDTSKVVYGQMPTHEDPVQPADEKYSYKFVGWEPELEKVEGDAEYKAKYMYIPMEYTITWKNEDGTVIDTSKVAYGEIPTHEDPIQPADAHYSYEFAGWNPEISEVKGPVEYRATYKYITNKYTVTWRNEDETILETQEVEYGTTPIYSGVIPTKESSEEFEYRFVGWEPVIEEIKGDVVYTAKYIESPIIQNEEFNDGNETQTGSLEQNTQNNEQYIQDFVSESQNNENSSGVQGDENGGVYEGSNNTYEDSSTNMSEGENTIQEGENSEEEQGFFGGLWETLKSFFLDDEDGYLRGSETIDNIIVSVEAEEGTFPEGTEVVIKGVSQERLETIQTSLVEDESNNVTEDAQILAFDISFVYLGEEIQPTKEVSVKFNYKDNSDFQGSSMSELSVYHIDDDTDEGEEVEVVNKDGDEIEILSASFSTFAVVAQKGLRSTPVTGIGIMDQMPDFDFTGLIISRPESISSWPAFYIIMDRNLGATSTDTSSADSYGYMYQWGNNYGFPSTGASLPSNQVVSKKYVSVDLTEYGPVYIGKTQYYSGVFITAPDKQGLSNREDWASTSNNDIWGDTTFVDEARQGPCPSGWHVPSMTEWSDAMAYWKAGSGNGSLNNFTNYLKLPKAGSRARSTADLQKSGEGWYYTSTPDGNKAYSLKFTANGNPQIYTENNRIDAQSIRCFKDELICESGMHAELNGCVSNYKTGHCMTGDVQNGYYTGYMDEITIEWTGGAWNIPMCELVCDEGFHEYNNTCVGGFVSVIFDLNGGKWYDGSIGNRDSSIEMGIDISDVRPKQDPYKNGYMFMGWFDESSNSAYRFKFQGTTLTGDLILTAHWAPFNDIVYTGIVGGEEKKLVLMDRNLGATATGAGIVTTPESYGYYYQWGNNYGFYYDNGTSINTVTTSRIYNASGFGPGNRFYGEAFVKGQTDWSSVSVNNLWGGVGDVESNDYDNGNKRYMRQGPCPKGYHVPSLGEWHKLVRLFMNNEYPNNSSTNILNTSWKGNKIGGGNDANYDLTPEIFDDILDTFYIPSAGRVTNNYDWNRMGDNPGKDGYRAPFWSSTVKNNSRALGFEMRFKEIKFNLGGWDDERAGAKAMRCFKDMDDYTVTWKNYDGTVLETDYYVYEGDTPTYNGLENPTKDELSEFMGWYLEGDENQTIVDLSTQSVNSDRAYVAKFIPIAPEDAYIVTVDVDPLTGGNVDKEPRYNSGDTVILTGIANSGYEFLGWFTGNNIVSLDNPYVFIADDSAGTGFTAVFSPLYNIYTGTNNELGGTISYEVVDITRQGKTIRFTATPTEDFELDKWILNGDDVATGGSVLLDVILSGNINLTGYFIQVANLPCNFHEETIPNGESIIGYQSDSVICPNVCVSQVATCNNGEWNVADFDTEYSYSSCNYSGFICSVEEYPLSSCPSNGICSSCIGYGVSENVCSELSPVYKLEGCQDHYHVSGNVCELDTYKVMIQSSNINSGTVTTGFITVPYGTNISKSGNILEIGSETSTANPNPQTWQYDFAFVDWTDTCGTTVTTGCTVTANFKSLLRTYTLDLVIGTGIETIYYKINGAGEFINTGITTTISGVEAGSTIYAYAEHKDGYTYTETSESNPWSVTVTGDNVFSPEATAGGVEYTVYHYVKRVGSGTYALIKTETGFGMTDEILTLSGLSKENEFPCSHYDRGSLTGTEDGPGEIVTQTTIKGDGSTKIYLYYTRNNRRVVLSGDAHIESLEIDGNESTEAVRECGGEVPINAKPKPGYHFVRWDRDREETEGDENNGIPGEG